MKKIIFDTDIGGDCDDTGALAIIHRGEDKGLNKLLAITLSTANPYSAGCADAINKYYGRDIEIGQTKIKATVEERGFFEEWYGKHIANKYENSYTIQKNKKPCDAIRLLRRKLSQNKGDKITIVVVGSCVNIAGLLKSGGDDISPLTGMELVKNNVEMLSLMGCFFPTEEEPEVWFGDYQMRAEFNIKCDIKGAKYVFENCPCPIVVSHYLLGKNILTGNILIENERDNPVAESYYFHSKGNRCSWDLISSYYAIYGCGDILDDDIKGTVSIDNKGISTFKENKNGKHIILDCHDYKKAEKRIDEALLG